MDDTKLLVFAQPPSKVTTTTAIAIRLNLPVFRLLCILCHFLLCDRVFLRNVYAEMRTREFSRIHEFHRTLVRLNTLEHHRQSTPVLRRIESAGLRFTESRTPIGNQ